MARIKEYDSHEALEAAMMLFWAQGYSATTVQQLLEAMTISRSSMYSEFGNKRDLFVEVLSLYNFLAQELVETVSRAEDPVEAIRGFYEVGFVQVPDKLLYRGCLFVNTILELRDVDNELSVIAANYFDGVEKSLVECFKKCARKGTLPEGNDPEQLASFFMTLIKGMRVVARQDPKEDYLRGVIETALLVLGKNE